MSPTQEDRTPLWSRLLQLLPAVLVLALLGLPASLLHDVPVTMAQAAAVTACLAVAAFVGQRFVTTPYPRRLIVGAAIGYGLSAATVAITFVVSVGLAAEATWVMWLYSGAAVAAIALGTAVFGVLTKHEYRSPLLLGTGIGLGTGVVIMLQVGAGLIGS